MNLGEIFLKNDAMQKKGQSVPQAKGLVFREVEIAPRGIHATQKHLTNDNIRPLMGVMVNGKRLDKDSIIELLASVSKANKNRAVTFGHLEAHLQNSSKHRIHINSSDKQKILKWAMDLAKKKAPRQLNRIQMAKDQPYGEAFGLPDSLGKGSGRFYQGNPKTGPALRMPEKRAIPIGRTNLQSKNITTNRFSTGLPGSLGSSSFGGNFGKK